MACPSTQVYFQHGAYLREVWCLFGLGSLVVVLRSAVRLRTVGWRSLQLDDYIAIAVWICFLVDSVTITLVYKYGSNLDWAGRDLSRLEPCQIKQIETGSRMQLLAWYTYTALIWGLKAMMLTFFHRLTIGLFQERLVKIFAVITAASYLAVFLTISCGCFPIQRNWQVIPLPPKDKCLMKYQNFYVTTALNVGTDALVLTIPIPLLWGMRVSFGRKVALSLLLCSGIFVIAAAIMRISFTFSSVNGLNINRWGTRETIAGIIAVNAPIIQPLFKRWFWQRSWSVRNRTPSPAFMAQLNAESRRHNRKSTIGTSRSRRRVRRSEIFGDTQGLHSRENSETQQKSEIYLTEEGVPSDMESGLGLSRPEITVETSVDIAESSPTPDKPAPVLLWPPDGETTSGRMLRSSRSYGSRTEISSAGAGSQGSISGSSTPRCG